ncbi:EpsG family protein [Roseateles noduli]|uniref:EpsG family protein n=1 Tax=Roseateles noduli TaxID=2052484 RepID=UPI003D662136
MEPYLFIFLVTAVLVPSDRMNFTPQARLASLSVPFVLLLLLTGTRVSTGNDWRPYYDYFANLSSLSDKADDFEIGYRLFAYVAKAAGLNNESFLLLSSFLYLGAFFLVFRKQRGAVALVLLFYCTYLLGWMGTARQVIAIGLTVLAGQSLLDGHRLRFFVLVLLAGTFHQTAVIFLLAWYLVRPVPRLWTTLAIVATCVAIGQTGKILLPVALDRFTGVEGLGDKLLFYGDLGSEELGQASGALLGVLWYVKRLVFLGFFLALRNHFNTRALAFYFNAYLLSVALFLMVDPTLPILATRGANYFSVYELFLLASLVATRARLSVLVIPMIILLSGQRLYTSLYAYHPDLYLPYKGLFINEDFRREVY